MFSLNAFKTQSILFFKRKIQAKSRFVLVPEAGDVYVETSERPAGEEAKSNQA